MTAVMTTISLSPRMVDALEYYARKERDSASVANVSAPATNTRGALVRRGFLTADSYELTSAGRMLASDEPSSTPAFFEASAFTPRGGMCVAGRLLAASKLRRKSNRHNRGK